MGRIVRYIMENKKCLKPPTSFGLGPSHLNPKRFSSDVDVCVFRAKKGAPNMDWLVVYLPL
jgi:hypothetical protein